MYSSLHSSQAAQQMETQRCSIPENAGERLMTTIIDDVSKSDPRRCFMSIQRSSDLNEELRDVSYASIARAINRCAWWMEDLLGKGVDHPTIATHLDPMDFRHVVLIFGAIKAGYKACLERSIRGGRRKLLLMILDVLQLSSQPPRDPGCAFGEA